MPRTVPVIASESPGNFLTGALWNANVKAMGDWMLGSGSSGVPRFSGYQNTAQSIPSNTFIPITLDSETIDSDGGHSTTTNPSRYTVQVAGTYLVIGEACFPANATGNRGSRITVNGANIQGGASMIPSGAGNTMGVPAAALLQLVVGDYVEVLGWQSSGAALNTAVATDYASSLKVLWVAG
ncbi:hypothetical protein [Streptomyces cavernae]|uniref:hypothetical protein n=1 Tax=Streptomyces cavernae TaxID=2259034 RepID=UPI000FEB916E|nr:hypothetical protein [Streptomyces cavernae]